MIPTTDIHSWNLGTTIPSEFRTGHTKRNWRICAFLLFLLLLLILLLLFKLSEKFTPFLQRKGWTQILYPVRTLQRHQMWSWHIRLNGIITSFHCVIISLRGKTLNSINKNMDTILKRRIKSKYMAISRHQKYKIQWKWQPTNPTETCRTWSVFPFGKDCNECNYMHDDKDMRLRYGGSQQLLTSA